MYKATLSLFWLLTFSSVLLGQEAEKRLALVIGNSNYEDTDQHLSNPINDANLMKTNLIDLGFEVMECLDCNKQDMEYNIDKFAQKAVKGKYNTALFYYAGHGIQLKGINYLVPVDAAMTTEAGAEYDCVVANRVLSGLEYLDGTNIIILDACRNNPVVRGWNRGAGTQGLAAMKAPTDTFIAYATQSGNTAADGAGTNGLYTSKLVEFLKVPNLKIEDVFKKTLNAVKKSSNGEQVPESYSSLSGDFYFKWENNDPDGDNIPNKYDNCPNVKGVQEYAGCPEPRGANDVDTDQDGIPDLYDHCPNEKGLKQFGGCPELSSNESERVEKLNPFGDRDGDGVPDEFDYCPDEKGEAKLHGCPSNKTLEVVEKKADQDGDGIPDAYDECPTERGLSRLGGCPDTSNKYMSRVQTQLMGGSTRPESKVKSEWSDNSNMLIIGVTQPNYRGGQDPFDAMYILNNEQQMYISVNGGEKTASFTGKVISGFLLFQVDGQPGDVLEISWPKFKPKKLTVTEEMLSNKEFIPVVLESE